MFQRANSRLLIFSLISFTFLNIVYSSNFPAEFRNTDKEQMILTWQQLNKLNYQDRIRYIIRLSRILSALDDGYTPSKVTSLNSYIEFFINEALAADVGSSISTAGAPISADRAQLRKANNLCAKRRKSLLK